MLPNHIINVLDHANNQLCSHCQISILFLDQSSPPEQLSKSIKWIGFWQQRKGPLRPALWLLFTSLIAISSWFNGKLDIYSGGKMRFSGGKESSLKISNITKTIKILFMQMKIYSFKSLDIIMIPKDLSVSSDSHQWCSSLLAGDFFYN